MKKELYEYISINSWLELARCVLELNINDKSQEEFDNNIKILKDNLTNISISSKIGKRYSPIMNEIGLSSLLQSIYDIESKNDARIHFYKQIQELSNLGIKQARYLGSFYSSDDCYSLDLFKNSYYLSKVYTDGYFKVRYDQDTNKYTLYEIRKANYTIDYILKNGKMYDNKVNFYTFNGVYPNKAELDNKDLPQLERNNKITDMHKTKRKVRMHY